MSASDNMGFLMVDELDLLIKLSSVISAPFFIIATLIIEIAYNTNECPDRHLEKLLISYIILESFFVISDVIVYAFVLDNDQRSVPCYVNCFVIGNTIWYIIGWCYLFSTPMCKQTNPHIWNILLAILIQKTIIYCSRLLAYLLQSCGSIFGSVCCLPLLYTILYFCPIKSSKYKLYKKWKTLLQPIEFYTIDKTLLIAEEYGIDASINQPIINAATTIEPLINEPINNDQQIKLEINQEVKQESNQEINQEIKLDIKNNSTLKYKCSICLEEFQSTSLVKKLPCSKTIHHVFCVKCIDDWLRINGSCPYCRKIYNRQFYQEYMQYQENQII